MKVDGCELSISSYLIAHIENKPIGTVGAWIEASVEYLENNKRQSLFKFIPKKNLLKSKPSQN